MGGPVAVAATAVDSVSPAARNCTPCCEGCGGESGCAPSIPLGVFDKLPLSDNVESIVVDGAMLFSTAGALTIFAGIAGYQAIDALRWRDGKRGVIAMAAFLALVAAAGFMFTFATQHATYNFWGNAGLGPDWECSNAPASARVCNRDLPPRLQDQPASTKR